eukprot:CAMPEP_0197826884 /NCGR_PEP_ID=MMETSP1437-20131217/3773_1 /TAXON_ID=49252 ORGANISM="Eucampia antarctica, Strain CCMP1452" /NCGR_SAMPLE_ID=MMETSP1437 /ASSEMBLY_ACC=CAM_ASM_001096 /LENGTH=46 /DNA_ID= /DNA_START= /DNA_END= /DNA_ORIENTATION=
MKVTADVVVEGLVVGLEEDEYVDEVEDVDEEDGVNTTYTLCLDHKV